MVRATSVPTWGRRSSTDGQLRSGSTSLCVICPATRQAKGYSFEVPVCTADGVTSVILADHVRSVDWKVRRVRRIETVPDEVLDEVIGRLEALLINPDC